MEAGRLNAYKAAPDAMRAVQRVEDYIQQCGLEKRLIELVKMRASQINGCTHCLHVHSKDARHGRETEPRLYLLDAWQGEVGLALPIRLASTEDRVGDGAHGIMGGPLERRSPNSTAST